MKKLLVLAAGILQIPVIKKAHEMGYYVIAADGDPNAVGLQYADKAIIANITSEKEMFDVARREEIDGVIHPCSEVSMNVMGYINDELHLHGISRDIAIRATNKHLMRKAFDMFGAPSPKSFCSANVQEGFHLFKSIKGTAILKPSRNSGSRGIAKIDSNITFYEFSLLFERSKKESRDKSVMIEQFVDGPEFSVEIIVWEGNINILQITDKKTTGAPYFVELGHSQPSLYTTEIVDAIRNAAEQGVKALGLNDCAAHAEVKYQNGKPYLMEIGARLGGDFISTELTHLSTGVDMVAAAINVALGIPPDLTPKSIPQGVAIRYFTPPSGTIDFIDCRGLFDCPEVYDANIYVSPGDKVSEVKSSLDRSGHVIIVASHVSDAIRIAEEKLQAIEIIMK